MGRTDVKLPSGVDPINSATHIQTGQTVSYNTNDDGASQDGRLNDWWNLTYDNYFGHSKRFTGLGGGYQDEGTGDYFDKDGNPSTRGASFPGEIFIDWAFWDQVNNEVFTFFSTYRAWQRASFSTSGNSLINWMAGEPWSDGLYYNDYKVVNLQQLISVYAQQYRAGDPFDYRPFNAAIVNNALEVYCKTSRINTGAQYYHVRSGGDINAFGDPTDVASTIMWRHTTMIELDSFTP